MVLYLKMFPNTLIFTILLVLFVASYPPTKGLKTPLIPPLSPKSSFYTQILEANNISTTAKNITLDQNHYMTWFLSRISVSPNEKSQYSFKKDAGVHVMSMYLGKPKQLMHASFDTGSGLTWFQCNNRAYKSKFPWFNQTQSVTYSTIRCSNKQLCDTAANRAIRGCDDLGDICEFKITYQDGTNACGELATEDITFDWPKDHVLVQYMFGCSWDNSIKLMGIIGASNNKYALPKQLYPDDPKFSYCISSDLKATNAVMFGRDANLKGDVVNMLRNDYYDSYYIDVYGIKVNGEHLAVKPSVFQMSESGQRGFIVDSGTTLTELTSEAFDVLKKKIEELRGPPTEYFVFEICYDNGVKSENNWSPWKKRPIIGIDIGNSLFEFEESKLWRIMAFSNGNKSECLQIIRTKSLLNILGNQLLFDVNVGHDPNNNLLFLQKTTCPTM